MNTMKVTKAENSLLLSIINTDDNTIFLQKRISIQNEEDGNNDSEIDMMLKTLSESVLKGFTPREIDITGFKTSLRAVKSFKKLEDYAKLLKANIKLN